MEKYKKHNISIENTLTLGKASLDDVADMASLVAKATGETSQYLDQINRLETALEAPTTWSYLLRGEDSTLLGFIMGGPGKNLETGEMIPDREHISWVMVHPDYWRIGIASSLLTTLCNDMRQRGVRQLTLWTEANNVRARNLYSRLGFREGRERTSPDTTRPVRQISYLKDLFTGTNG